MQAHAGARRVKMLTFDADDTLFPGGCSLSEDDWIVDAILTFLRKGLSRDCNSCCCGYFCFSLLLEGADAPDFILDAVFMSSCVRYSAAACN